MFDDINDTFWSDVSRLIVFTRGKCFDFAKLVKHLGPQKVRLDDVFRNVDISMYPTSGMRMA